MSLQMIDVSYLTFLKRPVCWSAPKGGFLIFALCLFILFPFLFSYFLPLFVLFTFSLFCLIILYFLGEAFLHPSSHAPDILKKIKKIIKHCKKNCKNLETNIYRLFTFVQSIDLISFGLCKKDKIRM